MTAIDVAERPRRRYSRNTAPQIAFLALFPLLFAYHLLAAMGVIPLVIGPGWSIINAIAAVWLGGTLLKRPERHRAFLALIAIIGVYAGGYYLLSDNEWQRNTAMLLESGKLITGLVSLYCVGLLLKNSDRFRRSLVVALVFMAAVTLIFMNPEEMTFIAIDRWDAPIGTAGYQWFAQCVSLTAIAALALSRGSRRKALVIGITVPTLFALFSRSEFLGFAIVVIVWCCVQAWRKQSHPVVLAAVSIAVGFAILFATARVLPSVEHVGAKQRMERAGVELSNQVSAADRQSEILNLPESASFQARLQMFYDGWSAIAASPLLGDYGGQMRDNGRFGDYIHNFLSAWRQYGMLGFLLYATLCLRAAFVTTRETLWRGNEDPMWMFALLATAYAVVLVVAAKSVFWPLPALAWGLATANRTQ